MAGLSLHESKRILVADMTTRLRAALGSMIAYDGDITFKKATFGGAGLASAVTRRMTGEKLSLMHVTGTGVCWFAVDGRFITLIDLDGELLVEATSILAFDDALDAKQNFAGLRGASSGLGLFTTVLKGTGQVAITADGPAIGLRVSGDSVTVDPDAYIAHTGGLQQDFITDVNWKTVLGETSGESYQLRFTGTGTVYVQPSERTAAA